MSTRPPGPISLSPLGMLPELPRRPLAFTTWLWQTYGDVVSVPLPLYQTATLINDPALVYEVLVKQAHSFQKPPLFMDIFSTTLGKGLFFSSGSLWQSQRKLAQPAFQHKRIEKYAQAMTHFTEMMLSTWQGGQHRNIAEDMQELTLYILCDAIFRTEISADAKALAHSMRDLSLVLADQAQNPVENVLLDRFSLPSQNRKRIARLDEIVYRMIHRRRHNRTESHDLISVFLEATDAETGAHLSDKQIRDEVVTLFMAGHETTATTLGWTWILLSQNPAAEAKLHAEVDAVLADGGAAGLADLPNLPYTEAIAKEVLRLYPSTWILYREALEDVTVGDYDIPKGGVVWLSPYLMHRQPRYFTHPNRFMPERFLTNGDEQPLEKRIPRFAYYPFGGGPRVCLGNGMAMLQLRLVIATIARRYNIQILPGYRPEASGIPGLGFKKDVMVQVNAR